MIFSVFEQGKNNVGIGENAGYQHFLLFPQCFEKLPTQDYSPFPKWQILDSSKLKEIKDNNSKFDENGRNFSIQVENTVEKGEIACYSIFKRLILQTRKNQGLFWKGLTLSQITNFILIQTGRVCRRQFQNWWKWQKVLQKDRKHCGKRRNCSLQATFPFSHSVLDMKCRHVKTMACLVKG